LPYKMMVEKLCNKTCTGPTFSEGPGRTWGSRRAFS